MKPRQLDFCSHCGNLSLMRSYVRQCLDPYPFREEEVELMVLGLDEACTNIIRHAYQNAEDQPIRLEMEPVDSGVCFRLIDFAHWNTLEDYMCRDLSEVRPGGLGVHFIRTAFDQISYVQQSKGTELVLVKYYQMPPQIVGQEPLC